MLDWDDTQDRSLSYQTVKPIHRSGESGMRAKPAKVTEFAAETIDIRMLLKVLSDFRKGDFSVRMPAEQTGLAGKVYDALNEVIDLNDRMSKELDRVSTVVGKEGRSEEHTSEL